MSQTNLKSCIVSLTLIFFSIALKAQIFVDASATGANDGTSWADAYTDLQPAIANSLLNEEIWVAQGFYLPTIGWVDSDEDGVVDPREFSFFFIKDNKFYGGFDGTETLLSQRADTTGSTTILSGDYNIIGDSTDNAYHVLFINGTGSNTVSSNFVFDGFTIQDGVTEAFNASSPQLLYAGAGLHVAGYNSTSATNPTIKNCIFRNNTAARGGALLCKGFNGEANPTFTNCSFNHNRAWGIGGGLFADARDGIAEPVFIGCDFNNNTAPSGGGCYNISGDPTYTNCLFTSNNSIDFGGALLNDGRFFPCNPIMTGCTFNSNLSNLGGAIFNFAASGGESSPTIGFCVFNANHATSSGGAIFNAGDFGGEANPHLDNCVMQYNTAGFRGGAVYSSGYNGVSNPIFDDCQFFANNSTESGGAIYNVGTLGKSNTTFNRCTFNSNSSSNNQGGAVYNEGSDGTSNVYVDECSFSFNTGTSGAAIFNSGHTSGESNAIITNSIFEGNVASSNGGAIYNLATSGEADPILENCIFYSNSAIDGGAMFNYAVNGISTPDIQNCTFYSNSATQGGALYNTQSDAVLLNCVLWNNGNEIVNNASSPSQINCIIEGGLLGALDQDPLFYIPSNPRGADNTWFTSDDGLYLQFCSPAIDAGAAVAFSTDILGNIRNYNGQVDMGAYEHILAYNTIFVNSNLATNGTGQSWSTAFNNLQTAIDVASICGKEIWVHQGTYYPTGHFDSNNNGNTEPREATFYLSTNIKLYGGFNGTETSLAQRADTTGYSTILNGDIGIPQNNTDNAYHVLFIDGASETIDYNTVIDGFLIQHGNTNSAGTTQETHGAGIYLDGSSGGTCSPLFKNCIITNNHAVNGGGLYIKSDASGVANPAFINCAFSLNTATIGGAILNDARNSGSGNPTFANCYFTTNHATLQGGAVASMSRFGGTSIPIYTDCTFYNNSAVSTGGAIIENSAPSGNSSSLINNCVFDNNSAGFGGGAISNLGYGGLSNPTLNNCLFTHNAAGNGGAIRNDGRDGGDASPLLTNCTFFNNTTTSGSAGGAMYCDGSLSGNSTPTFQNCILWKNEDEIANNSASPSQVNSIISGGLLSAWNIDPIFNNESSPIGSDGIWRTADDGLYLRACSPAIDAGIAVGFSSDIVGNNRSYNGSVDLGSYEDQGSSVVPRILRVNGLLATDGDGSTWANAFNNLQAAINASCAGDEIWVQQGTYYPSAPYDSDYNGSIDAREVVIFISKNIKIYGGFDGSETSLGSRADKTGSTTILTGDIGIINNKNDNSLHVVAIHGTAANPITSNMILDGFTIRDGNTLTSGLISATSGGGIYLEGSGSGNSASPIISNCLLISNDAYNGGGLFANGQNGTSNPIIGNCSFHDNEAYYGGAMYCTAQVGGVANAVINNSTFTENTGFAGGGIYVQGAGGTSNPTVNNGTFYNNLSNSGFGGALYNDGQAGGICNPSLVNSIFWNNGNAIYNVSANPTATTCIIEGGLLNSWNIDPLFIDTDNLSGSDGIWHTGDDGLRLRKCSPALDAGITSGLSTDILGNPRAYNSFEDLGPYEYQGVPQPAYLVHVNIAAAGGNGKSWATAMNDLQEALDFACEGDVIWVAEGEYLPTGFYDSNNNGTNEAREATFYIDKNIKLYGGFAGTETSIGQRLFLNHPSLLSGDIGVSNDSTDNAFHVMYIDAINSPLTNLVINGFDIKYGNTDQSGSNFQEYCGGGMYLDGSINPANPTISNCFIEENSAVYGGGIYNYINANPLITNCAFMNNFALYTGGGIQNNGNLIHSSPTIINCNFIMNEAGLQGGAIMNYGGFGNSSPTIINTNFTKNIAPAGGAVYNFGENGISTPVFNNCIVWDNGDEIIDYFGSMTQNNSLIRGGIKGALDENPQFINASSPKGADGTWMTNDDGLHVRMCSPVVDMGDNAATTYSSDFRYQPRQYNGTIDIGAYEYQGITTPNLTLLVDGSAGNGGFGSSWADAFNDLQEALDFACEGDVIWVAEGEYLPTGFYDSNNNGTNEAREATFYFDKNITLYGGFAGTETNIGQRLFLNHPSRLSGDIGVSNDSTDNAFHVMYIDAINSPLTNLVINGFEIKYGHADQPGSNVQEYCGGGLYIDGSINPASPTITSCFIENNSALYGGGIYNYINANPLITNCAFMNNFATYTGGGIHNNGNLVNSSPNIANCNFTLNSSGLQGGAIMNYGGLGNSSPLIRNCTFTKNQSPEGGAIYNYGVSGISSLTINNSILWNNGDEIDGNAYTFIQNNSIIEGGLNGAINVDPMFTHASNPKGPDGSWMTTDDGLLIRTGSPAINAGNNALMPYAVDFRYLPRPQDITVDIGAYEYNGCVLSIVHGPGLIDQGLYIVDQQITSSGLIESGIDVQYKAAQSIELNPGFEVEIGGTLEIDIDGCSP